MESLMLRGRVLFPDGVLRDGEVTIEGDSIVGVAEVENGPVPKPSAAHQIIAPGFIDLQVNGAFGHDFTADPETIHAVAAALTATGVTAFLPTIITSPLETYTKAFAALAPRATAAPPKEARILGWHLEGPYLSPQRPGAHDPQWLRAVADPLADGLIDGNLRLMTLAPEVANGLQAIRDLRAQGVVVSLGHTGASYAQASAALDAGATWGTHLFNAMTPLHHREPGVIGALLADERATFGIIPDGVHLHPSLFGWLIRAKGAGRITLVTDAMAAAGLGPGEYQLGQRRVSVDATSARLENGVLAGSVLTLDRAVRNLVSWGACSVAEALTMASAAPARLLGEERLGRIATGCSADIVVLDAALRVRQTIVGGAVVFSRDE
jgi:N-acetylglucosamine-6-phosphate deacetylase